MNITIDLIFFTKEEEAIEIINSLIEYKVDLDLKDENGDFPLSHAIKKRYFIISDILLKNNANAKKTNQNKETLLHLAARVDNAIIVKNLATAGVDLNQFNQDKKTALDIAIENDNINTAADLIFFGAKFDA